MSSVLGHVGLIAIVGLVSCLGTALVRRYALARGLMDTPNARSSHVLPTPRGGGVAIVLSFVLVLPVLTHVLDVLPANALWALLGGGALVAVVGFIDDHRHIEARWRLLTHFAAAIWVLLWLGVPSVSVLGWELAPGGLGLALAALYLVWLLNLYNFMDGIDGIAGVEAICVCVGGAVLYSIVGEPLQALVPLILASAVAGFLWWNFPPARIFMGDAGSGFLGLVLGALSIQAALVLPALYWSWLILLGVFIVDATVTLLRRLARGERVHLAHRSHAYQHAARHFGAHRPVTLAVLAINGLWLMPVAAAVAMGFMDGVVGMLLSYVPLVWLALHFRAGVPD